MCNAQCPFQGLAITYKTKQSVARTCSGEGQTHGLPTSVCSKDPKQHRAISPTELFLSSSPFVFFWFRAGHITRRLPTSVCSKDPKQHRAISQTRSVFRSFPFIFLVPELAWTTNRFSGCFQVDMDRGQR